MAPERAGKGGGASMSGKVSLGRPRSISDEQVRRMRKMRKEGLKLEAIARELSVSVASVGRLLSAGEKP